MEALRYAESEDGSVFTEDASPPRDTGIRTEMEELVDKVDSAAATIETNSQAISDHSSIITQHSTQLQEHASKLSAIKVKPPSPKPEPESPKFNLAAFL